MSRLSSSGRKNRSPISRANIQAATTAIRFEDFHRIFWWRRMNSSLRNSKPSFLLVMPVSAEMFFFTWAAGAAWQS